MVLLAPLMVTVSVALVNVPALESQLPSTVRDAEPDIVNVPPVATVRFPNVPVPVVPMFRSFVLRSKLVPERVNVPLTLTALSRLFDEPLTVRFVKPAVPLILIVLLGPEMVTVLVPFVNVEPAPLVSQFPDTAQDPDVRVMVPLVPPVIVTSPTVTVAWLPLTTPPLFTVRVLVPKENVPEFPAVSVRVPVTEIAPEAVMVPVVMLNVVPEPTVTEPTVMDDVVPAIPPVPTRETDAHPVTLLPEVVSVPDPDVASVLLTSIAVVCETVPETVRL
jgi:hypothetical protein